MKHDRILLIILLSLLVTGCKKEIQVDGLAFSPNLKGEIITHTGMKVFFLHGKEKAEAELFVEQWRKEEYDRKVQKYNEDVANYNQKLDRYNSTPQEKRNPYSGRLLEDQRRSLSVAKGLLDTSWRYPFHNEEFHEFLKDKYFIITDPKGEFTVRLKKGVKYLVVADSGGSLMNDEWFFEYVAQSTRLILADSNSAYRD
ncbi:MAG: hypothetical protein ACSHX4_04045 [Opitutaceae bacterium]